MGRYGCVGCMMYSLRSKTCTYCLFFFFRYNILTTAYGKCDFVYLDRDMFLCVMNMLI